MPTTEVQKVEDLGGGRKRWTPMEVKLDIAARVRSTANQSISNNTLTAVDFDTEDFDTDTIHDNVTNKTRLTATTAGKYIIGANIIWASNETGRRGVYLRLNGTTYVASDRKEPEAESDSNVSTCLELNATDYVEVVVRQTSGGSLNVITDQLTNFWMARKTE